MVTATASSTPTLLSRVSGLRQTTINPSRAELISAVIEKRQAIVTPSGALAAWNPSHSTGRIPKDTYMVRDAMTENTVDWKSSACNPMTPELFDRLMDDAMKVLEKRQVLILDRSVGHDTDYALPVKLVTDSPLVGLFADTMFCPMSAGVAQSVFAKTPFTLVVVPADFIDTNSYSALLRAENGKTVPQVIAIDFTRKMGLVYGTKYLGAVKKTIFTVLNYLLPQEGVLPLHCSTNEASDRTSTIFLGLSGTGKTTLSNDPMRTLIGDDEHGWTDEGIFNLEGGCYAKLIRLRKEKEPDVFNAVFGKRELEKNGCIIENAMTYPDGTIDVDDERLTENSRASYPLHFLKNTREQAMTVHPKTVIFLTADAQGVLPPAAVLTREQAMLWFLMGYTSKLAGTEKGVIKPTSAFSRFFGAPFMPALPAKYLELFGQKLDSYGSQVFLINTGWTGGPYGTGQRFDIDLTRKLVTAALDGSLAKAKTRKDARFKLQVPTELPGIDAAMLDPKTTWKDGAAFEGAADSLAKEFVDAFKKSFQGMVAKEVEQECPGM